jgi:tRNA-Thr(GGU) m(6)t(6)A37 methyltransferase TsaA
MKQRQKIKLSVIFVAAACLGLAFPCLFGKSFTLAGASESAKGAVKAPAGEHGMPTFTLKTIGRVIKENNRTFLFMQPEYLLGLDGLADFSHIWVIYWFHKNDTPEKRRILKLHPRGNPDNPLTGVFATRSPVRPNLLGLSVCQIVSVKENRIEVEGLDAWEDTPILDIKPYLPELDSVSGLRTPPWVRQRAWGGDETLGKGQH